MVNAFQRLFNIVSLLTASDFEWMGKSVGGRSEKESGPDSRRRHNLRYFMQQMLFLERDTGFPSNPYSLKYSYTNQNIRLINKQENTHGPNICIMAYAKRFKMRSITWTFDTCYLTLDASLLLMNNNNNTNGPTSFVSRNSPAFCCTLLYLSHP